MKMLHNNNALLKRGRSEVQIALRLVCRIVRASHELDLIQGSIRLESRAASEGVSKKASITPMSDARLGAKPSNATFIGVESGSLVGNSALLSSSGRRAGNEGSRWA